MSSCGIETPLFQAEDGKLDVSVKYSQLMADTLDEDSLYTRAKDTFYTIFKDLQVPEPDRAKMAAEFISQMAVQMSAQAMTTALQWAKEERDGAYALAKVKADTELVLANKLKTEEEICLVGKQTELQCANIEATIADSIRKNGKVTQYDANNPCKPTDLENSGLLYEQAKQVEAATYQAYADAYRKSGVVQIGVDQSDNITKGLSGPTEKIVGGYTNQQTLNAERQRQAYEDSKINNLVNGSAVVTGQMMSAEVPPSQEVINLLIDGLRKLATPNSETPDPFPGV